MIAFLSLHLGTIIVGLLVLASVIWIVVGLVRDKRKGKCLGCDCASCPSHSHCGTK